MKKTLMNVYQTLAKMVALVRTYLEIIPAIAPWMTFLGPFMEEKTVLKFSWAALTTTVLIMENASLTLKMASMDSPVNVLLAMLGHCVELIPHFPLRATASCGSQMAHIQPDSQIVTYP